MISATANKTAAMIANTAPVLSFEH